MRSRLEASGSGCDGELRTIPERIFCQLREAIVNGALPPGSRINEAELAARYGVSRAPLREAISRLAAIGLVDRRPNVGARIVQLSVAHLLEVFQVREALEGMAARQAARRMPVEALRHLHVTLDEHEANIQEEVGEAYFQEEGDLDFHYQVIQGSFNHYLIKLLCHDLYHLIRMYRCQFGMRSSRGPAALQEHRAIVKAVERHDEEAAEWLMRAHVRASRENVERMLQEHTGQVGECASRHRLSD